MTAEQSLQEHAGLIALLPRKYTWAGEYEDLHQIAQAAWVRGWEASETKPKWPTFDKAGEGESFRKSCAVYAVRAALHRHGKKLFTQSRQGTTLSLHDVDATGTPWIDRIPSATPEVRYYADEQEAVRSVLNQLPPAESRLLRNHYFERRTLSQLAAVDDVTPQAMTNRLNRALRRLRLRYQEAVA
jgi:RNA polymerase sigma factor (sigma-70 family)